MKLKAISIHNFRGVLDERVNIYDYTLLVGANNGGKSTVIDAIRAFYEKDGFKYKHDRDFPFIKTADAESWIELTFSLSDSEHDSLKTEYQHAEKVLHVRKYFKATDKSCEGTIFGYLNDGALSDESFYGAKNVQSGKFGQVVFIPAVSKVDEHAKLSGPSALRDLLTNVLESVVASSPSYAKFSTNFDEFASEIKTEKTDDGRSLAGFEQEICGLLKEWQTGFRLDLKSPSTAEIIKTLLSYQCVDQAHGKSLMPDQFGSGFQRHFIYSLIQLGARYVGKKASKKSKDFAPSMNLILFEEPEAFLHPPQQEVLAESLVTLVGEPDQQVICSTHSSHFVSRSADRIPSIVRLRRDSGRMSVGQIDAARWTELVDANQSLNRIAPKYPTLGRYLADDDLKPEMEAVKYFLWLNPDRCGLFFANHVLIVEGPSEKALINKMVGDRRISRPDRGMYVLDGMGKHNIHRFMNLLASLGISHSVLHDDDEGRNEHAEMNRLIADSKHAKMTIRVVQIPNNIEAFLAIPAEKGKHRKPQHLLFLYESKQIQEEKLAEFSKLVSACLPPPPISA